MRTGTVGEAAEVLRSGGVVISPTETVVGLFSTEAGLARVIRIKGRDPNQPVALLCLSAEEAFSLAERVPPLARKLAGLHWPGPLTLVLDRAGGTVGVRVPDHPTVRELLAAVGEPLYATSANPSGKPAPGALKDVSPRVLEAADVVVPGEAGGGEASAVVDVSGGKAAVIRATRFLDEEKLAVLAATAEG